MSFMGGSAAAELTRELGMVVDGLLISETCRLRGATPPWG